MRMSSKRKYANQWLKKDQFRSQNSNMTLDTGLQDSFGALKREVKKIGIMTRMQNRTKTSISAYNKTRSKTSDKLSMTNHPNDFKKIEKEYLRERSLIRTTLEEEQKPKSQVNGLLGQWKRYEQFSKQQLIEKLISLQHLANTIFKRNKFLEEEIKKVQQKVANN